MCNVAIPTKQEVKPTKPTEPVVDSDCESVGGLFGGGLFGDDEDEQNKIIKK